MKRLFHLTTFFLVTLHFIGSIRAENELFPFVISFDAPNNVTNLSAELDAPAGKNGFVRVQDGHFATDKGRIQFWGTNTCFGANFLDKDQADRMADRMARFGINCVRLHHMDARDIWGKNYGRTNLEFDPEQIDKLDYYIAALKKRGIYVNINLHVSRVLDDRDGFPIRGNRPSADKGIDNYYRPFIEANKKYAKDLLEHVNPYTGNVYKDEPSVAMIEINNENSVVCMWGGWGGLDVIQDPFLGELRTLWNDWLRKKYKDDAGLRKAWNCRTIPFGDEMLRNGDFPKGYIPKYDGWNWEVNKETDAPISNDDGILRMDVRSKGTVQWHPQLIASGFGVKKDQLYTLTLKARASETTTLSIGVRMNHEPWGGLGFDATAQLSTEWKTLQYVFTPNADDPVARIGISSMQEGVVYEIDSVSLKPGGEIGLPKERPHRRELILNGTFSKGYLPGRDGWSWEVDPKVESSVTNEKGVLKLDVRKKGEVEWHPQLIASGFGVEKGKKYTLTLRAKASRKTTPTLGVRMNHEPWNGLGFDASADLTEHWKTFTWIVTPAADDSNARLGISRFEEGVVYEIDFVSLKEGIDDEPVKEASLAAGTVPIVWKKDAGQYSKETTDDFCDFIMDLEAKYWDEMFRYLKDDIKVRQPVSGTQLQYGSTHAQAAMDYCDIHSYWNHPTFPGRPWDGNNWYLRNRALVNYMDRAILPSLSTSRVHGKPFTVSEYNHPYPNQYAGEGLPLLAAFGAFQGWDGIFPFAYSHSKNIEPQRAGGFFDTVGNTVQMAHMIACHNLFCRGYNKDADAETIVAPLSIDAERDIFKRTRHVYSFNFSGLGLDPRIALTRPVAVDVSGKIKDLPKLDEIDKERKTFSRKKDEIDYLRYDMQTPEKGWVSICNPGGALFTGFVDEEKTYPFVHGEIRFGKTNLGWATVSMTGMKGNGMLLVATGEMLNTDMKIEHLDEDKITVGNRWGKDPVRCEGIPATVRLDKATGKVKCWALDESGNRKREIDVKKAGDGFELELKPEYKTIWYEIETVR